MALSSRFERILGIIDSHLGEQTQTEDQKMELVRQALEQDMAQQFSDLYSTREKRWSFRAIDVAQFRLLTNATLDDTLQSEDGVNNAVVETDPWDMKGAQIGIAVVSLDADGDGVSFDLCVDANASDETAGSFLVASGEEAEAFDPDTEILLDTRVCKSVVLQITVELGTVLRAASLRLTLLGNAELLAIHENAIANFAVARFFERRLNDSIYHGNDPQQLGALNGRYLHYRRAAVGFLTDESKKAGGESFSVIRRGGGIWNRAWERLKGMR